MKSTASVIKSTLAWRSRALLNRIFTGALLFVSQHHLCRLHVFSVDLVSQDCARTLPGDIDQFAEAGVINAGYVRSRVKDVGAYRVVSALVDLNIPEVTFGQIVPIAVPRLLANQ